MVAGTSSGAPSDWREHIDGKPNYAPPVPPLAPAKLTAGLYLKGNIANCTNFASSEQKADATYVQTVAPHGAGTTAGMLGFMFWAAEYKWRDAAIPATVPPNTCEGGMGVAATTFAIGILRRPCGSSSSAHDRERGADRESRHDRAPRFTDNPIPQLEASGRKARVASGRALPLTRKRSRFTTAPTRSPRGPAIRGTKRT